MSLVILKILFELAILGASVSFIIFIPEIFPRCAICRKIKLRFRFLLHTHISLSLTRNGNKSICKKCCSKENIHTFSDFTTKHEIKKRAKYKTKYTF